MFYETKNSKFIYLPLFAQLMDNSEIFSCDCHTSIIDEVESMAVGSERLDKVELKVFNSTLRLLIY